MLKTENKEATAMNSVASTKCLPGQILFPNPNVDIRTGSSRKLPSAFRNRSGLKISGSGYRAGSCNIALKITQANVGTIRKNIVYHAFPITTAPGMYAWVNSSRFFIQAIVPTFWYEEALIDVILCGCMWDSWQSQCYTCDAARQSRTCIVETHQVE
jgi:hypothetical protein